MIHKEGYLSLAIVATISLLLTILTGIFWGNLYQITLFLSIVIFLIVLQFFRNPNRSVALIDDRKILAPADGKIVVIEQVEETEYLVGIFSTINITLVNISSLGIQSPAQTMRGQPQ